MKVVALIGGLLVILAIAVVLISNRFVPANATKDHDFVNGFTLSPKNTNSVPDFFSELQSCCNSLAWYGSIVELKDEASGFNRLAKTAIEQKLEFVPVLTSFSQNSGELLEGFAWTDEKLYQQLLDDIIEKYNLRYLGLGIEVNLLYKKNITNFVQFKSFFNQTYSILKEKFPDIKIFSVLQYELEENPELFLTEFKFGDLFALTTYPEIKYKTVSEIPLDYYARLRQYSSNREIALTEIGWNRNNSQAEFLEVLRKEFLQLRPKIAIWSFLFDPQTNLTLFKNMGLKDQSFEESKGWNKWLEITK